LTRDQNRKGSSWFSELEKKKETTGRAQPSTAELGIGTCNSQICAVGIAHAVQPIHSVMPLAGGIK
jgi:hypothetical protein